MVKGSNRGASTGADGTFSVQAQSGDALVISIVGYEKKEIRISDQSTLSIALPQRISALEEAVVVGYGTQRKATLTGAVASINNKQIKHSPVLNLSNALAGQLPGIIASNRTGRTW